MNIRLDDKSWIKGSPLLDGEGGFGKVFDVHDEDGNVAVAKFVPKDPGAERELLMGDSLKATTFRNVVPVLDKGEHEGQWVIVMPKADKSLWQHLQAASGHLQLAETIEILQDIATALADLAGEIVHRDLKPQNVLRLRDTWCLADFGIARYAEATTAADTRKYSLSRPYAAPEQWRFEQATSATDVYAFGVIAHQLMSGQLPFPGPDFRQQHLTQNPPTLTSGTARLRTLIEECLWKPPAARPSPANILARLETSAEEPSTPGLARLALANYAETERLARDHVEAAEKQEHDDDRGAMFVVAQQSFDSLTTPLLAAIEANAPVASIERSARNGSMLFVARLRAGKLGISHARQSPEWSGPFTVIADANISVNTEGRDQWGHEGRSHSLWFCDAQERGRFAWYESAFMPSPFTAGATSVAPFALDPASAAIALSGVIGTTQLAWPFEEIDRADPTEFLDRWIGWFADAADRGLHRPSTMPEKPTAGSWRR